MTETVTVTLSDRSAVQTLTLGAIKHVPLEEIIRRVLDEQISLIIQVSDDQEVTIQPKPRLRPLRVLPGYVPEGWKDAIYA